MSSVDFTEWAVQDLVLRLGGATYSVAPPSVATAKVILALAVQSEINLGLAAGPLPDDLRDALEHLMRTPMAEVCLGAKVYQQLLDDGHPAQTIDRMGYYAMHYWARGKARADALALVLWATHPEQPEDDAPGEAQGLQ